MIIRFLPDKVLNLIHRPMHGRIEIIVGLLYLSNQVHQRSSHIAAPPDAGDFCWAAAASWHKQRRQRRQPGGGRKLRATTVAAAAVAVARGTRRWWNIGGGGWNSQWRPTALGAEYWMGRKGIILFQYPGLIVPLSTATPARHHIIPFWGGKGTSLSAIVLCDFLWYDTLFYVELYQVQNPLPQHNNWGRPVSPWWQATIALPWPVAWWCSKQAHRHHHTMDNDECAWFHWIFQAHK